MAIAAIFVLTAVAFALLYFGSAKEDFATLFFASSVFILLGLSTFIYGFEELAVIYTKWLGIIFMAFGSYVGIRAGLEQINNNI